MVADEASLRVLSTVMSPAFQHSNPTIYIRSSHKKYPALTAAFYFDFPLPIVFSPDWSFELNSSIFPLLLFSSWFRFSIPRQFKNSWNQTNETIINIEKKPPMSLIETLVKLKVPISRLCSIFKTNSFCTFSAPSTNTGENHFSRADKIILSHFSINA